MDACMHVALVYCRQFAYTYMEMMGIKKLLVVVMGEIRFCNKCYGNKIISPIPKFMEYAKLLINHLFKLDPKTFKTLITPLIKHLKS